MAHARESTDSEYPSPGHFDVIMKMMLKREFIFVIFCLSVSAMDFFTLPETWAKSDHVGNDIEIHTEKELDALVEKSGSYTVTFWFVFNGCALVYMVWSLQRFSKHLSKDAEVAREDPRIAEPCVQIFFENECSKENYFALQAAHVVSASGLKCSVQQVPHHGELPDADGEATMILFLSSEQRENKIRAASHGIKRSSQFALFIIDKNFTSTASNDVVSGKLENEYLGKQLFSTQIIQENDTQIDELFYDWIRTVVDQLSPMGSSYDFGLLTSCSDFGYYNKKRLVTRDWVEAIAENTHPWKQHEIFSGRVVAASTKNDVKRVTLEINHYEDLNFQYGLLDRARIVPKNNLESILFLCKRCGLDSNMVVEFISYLPDITLNFPPHISIRNLLLHYLDIHQPINQYMLDLMRSQISLDEMKSIEQYYQKNTRINILDVLRENESLILSLELLAEMLQQVQNVPLRVTSFDYSEGLVSFIHDSNYSDQSVSDHSRHLNSLNMSQEVHFYFARSQVSVPYERNLDVVLIADELGAHCILKILDCLSQKRVSSDVTVIVEASSKEITDRLTEYNIPNLTIYHGKSIFALLKQNSVWLRKVITLQNSFIYIDTSGENVQKLYTVLIQSLCMPAESNSLDDLDVQAMSKLMTQLSEMQKENKFIVHVF